MGACSARFTHVFDHELVQILDGLFLQHPLKSTQNRGYGTNQDQALFDPLAHRVMNEVHGVSDVVVHASEGHEQVSVFEAFQDAGREDVQRLSGGAFNPKPTPVCALVTRQQRQQSCKLL